MNTVLPQQKQDILAKNILNRIEQDEIVPTAKGVYVFKNMFFWLLWILTTITGSIAVAMLIFTELNVGWEFYEMTHQNALTFFANSLPYLWLIFLLLVSVFGLYNFRHTKTGYRYSLIVIVSTGVLMSIMGGFVLHTFGIGAFIDKGLGQAVPMYKPAHNLREVFWVQPERGLYTGSVESIDPEHMTMNVLLPDGTMRTFSTKFIPQIQQEKINLNARIRIIATSTDSNKIIACRILEWQREVAKTLTDVSERRQMFRTAFQDAKAEFSDDIDNPCTRLLPKGRGMMMRE